MMWPCDIESRERPAVRRLGSCTLCDRHLCSVHLESKIHTCPTWEDWNAYAPAFRSAEHRELTTLFTKLNIPALTSLATKIRGGQNPIPCSVPMLQTQPPSSVMGGMNYHVEVKFQDGVTWMARIRRSNAISAPTKVRDHILRSEVATLRFLERTRVPVLQVFDFGLEGEGEENSVGVGYILMEKTQDKALEWQLAGPEQKRKVMGQLADMFIELRKYPFDRLGALVDDGELEVGPFARVSLTDFVGGEMKPIGPCSSLEEYHVSFLRLVLDLILRDEMYSQRAVDAYLIHRYLLDLVPKILPRVPPEENNKYYLRHGDDKGDHILVDDDYNITGIIDWEWAYITSPAVAFNSPIALLPVAAFYEGENELADDETVLAQLLLDKGSPDLAEYVLHGRLQHRFEFCSGGNLEDWSGFVGLFRGLRDGAGCDDAGLDWEEWKSRALERYKDDDGLRVLLSRQ